MQKFLFDKEIVNNQLSVLNNTLNQQRQTKKTLLSHLEKFSNAIYENFDSDDTNLLVSLINEAHSIFECIKSNINKTLELKIFLENISKSNFLNTIDAEKFNNDFNLLLDNISKTNSNYLNFMNNYEKFITPTIKEEIIEENIPEAVTEEVVEECIPETVAEEVVEECIPETVTEEIIEESIPETVAEEIVKESIETTESLNLSEKTLIIDRKSEIAILPYTLSALDELFLDDPEKYSSIQDIIDKEYTVPLKNFENTSISKYREAFKLAKEKSNFSFSQAANFAKKLLVENKITTIVIAACKNTDELDFYIECLNNNELNKFDCFKIIEK